MLKTVVMEAMVGVLFMAQVVKVGMGVIATPVKAEMVVMEGAVLSVKVETVAMAVMDQKVGVKQAKEAKALWEKDAMVKTVIKNKGLKMKNRFFSAIVFGLVLMPSISMTAYDTKKCDLEKLNVYESTRAKDGEHGSHAHRGADGQNGQDGQNGLLGLDGGHGGNGGNSDWGKGGDGGNGGDVD
jgi:hypothetical protein